MATCIEISLLLLFSGCVHHLSADDQDSIKLIIPTIFKERVERFVFDDLTYYVFHFQRVGWEEAYALCHGKNGTLAYLHEQAIHEFIGSAMAESGAENYEYMWIGAYYDKNKWIWEDEKLPPIKADFPNGTEFPREESPPWMEDPTGKNFTYMCLAVERYDHENAVFVPLPCTLQRPYICQLHYQEPVTIEPDATFMVNHTKFLLYNDRMTWKDAVHFCRKNRFNLAHDLDLHKIFYLGERMLRIRPVIENAWIGGYYSNESKIWSWINSEPIEKEMPSVITEDGSTVKYPPWYRKEVKQAGCLTLDRHVCSHPVFLEAQCSRRKPVICMKVMKKIKPDGNDTTGLIPIKGTKFWINTYPLKWEPARKICLEHNLTLYVFTENGTDEFLTDIWNIKHIKTINNENEHSPEGIRHIWLGARFVKAEWRWVGKNSATLDYIGEPFTSQAVFLYGKERLKFCTDLGMEDREDMSCLNLTRENHAELILYGLSCNFTQRFLCKGDTINT